jgi:hypothetical protein
MAEERHDDALVTIVVGAAGESTDQEQPVEVLTPPAEGWPLDEVCAGAVDLARDTLLQEADGSLIGDHTGVIAEGPMVVTHYFQGQVPGYRGWRWAVTLSRAPDSSHVTVDETALLPNGDALLAPAWVPWKQRIESGDLGPGDVMVTEADDSRLSPGMAGESDVEDDERQRPEQWELGLGRIRVLSPEGRREAAQRWYHEVGPRAAAARATKLECSTCGFLLMIGGPMGQAFGVCANEYSPVDGRIVALSFGCGAHSETREKPSVGVAQTVIDEVAFDDLTQVKDAPVAEPQEASQAEDSRTEGSQAEDSQTEAPQTEAPQTEAPQTEGVDALPIDGEAVAPEAETDTQSGAAGAEVGTSGTQADASNVEVGQTPARRETMPEPGPKEDT